MTYRQRWTLVSLFTASLATAMLFFWLAPTSKGSGPGGGDPTASFNLEHYRHRSTGPIWNGANYTNSHIIDTYGTYSNNPVTTPPTTASMGYTNSEISLFKATYPSHTDHKELSTASSTAAHDTLHSSYSEEVHSYESNDIWSIYSALWFDGFFRSGSETPIAYTTDDDASDMTPSYNESTPSSTVAVNGDISVETLYGHDLISIMDIMYRYNNWKEHSAYATLTFEYEAGAPGNWISVVPNSYISNQEYVNYLGEHSQLSHGDEGWFYKTILNLPRYNRVDPDGWRIRLALKTSPGGNYVALWPNGSGSFVAVP